MKTSCPLSPVTIRLDAQFGTPYPRSAGFDTDIGAFIESSSVSLECRLEWLRLEYEEVEGGKMTNKARISSILALFSCL